jgi:2-dehydro-3-deoxy-D-arabinonate dehydratase
MRTRRPPQEEQTVPLCLYCAAKGATPKLGLIDGDSVIDVAANGGPQTLAQALQVSASELRSQLDAVRANSGQSPMLATVELAAPIDQQEVWASGVTYLRSRDARMEESTQRDVYDIVYDAERPELFFKATASRVSGPGETIGIRGDSTWDVPEPELALVVNKDGEIAGYTIGNDVSSRSIEGENPLYLPQAKVYSKCAAVGPQIVLKWEIDNVDDRQIRLVIKRGGAVLFDGNTATSQIHRSLDELVMYLRRHNEFPAGVILMTGTGIIPPSEFTLEDGDQVEISIDGIGTLTNPVVRLTS